MEVGVRYIAICVVYLSLMSMAASLEPMQAFHADFFVATAAKKSA